MNRSGSDIAKQNERNHGVCCNPAFQRSSFVIRSPACRLQLSNRRVTRSSQPAAQEGKICMLGRRARRKGWSMAMDASLAHCKMHGRSDSERSHRVVLELSREEKRPNRTPPPRTLHARHRRNTRKHAGPRRRARARARRGVRRPGAGRAAAGHAGVLERPQGAPAVAARPAERLLRPAEPRDDDLRLGAAGRGGDHRLAAPLRDQARPRRHGRLLASSPTARPS